MLKNIKESDLHDALSEYFEEQGYTIHCEVNFIDMVAQRDGELIAIELKKSCSTDLLIQATQRQLSVDSVYIAIPHMKHTRMSLSKWNKMAHLVKRLSLGLITVMFDKSNNGLAEVLLHPDDYTPQPRKKGRQAIIREISQRTYNYNVAGSTKVSLMTAYREKALAVAVALQKYGNSSPKKLRDYGCDKNCQGILQNNFYGWFNRVQRGVYELDSSGEKALAEYPELVKKYKSIFEKNRM